MKLTGKSINFIFWLAPALMMAGLTAGVVSGVWSPGVLGLLIIGFVMLLLWVLYRSNLTKGFWGRRSTEASTNALISTLAVLLILGLINFLGVRYGTRIDFTETQLFTLAPQTQDILQNLKNPVKVWVFSQQPNPQVKELLERYQRAGKDRLSFEFVDPQAQPGLANSFGVKDYDDVYLEAIGLRQENGKPTTETRRDFVGSVKTEPLTETRLTNALARIQSDRQYNLYFLQGHGERPLDAVRGGLSQAVRTLQDRNYTAQPLNLADRSDGVPADADVVVIAGPRRALFESEVTALQDYLQRGGSVFIALDPGVDAGLDPLLREWGVKFDNRFAVDATGQGRLVGLGPAEPLVSNYGDHPITRDFRNGFSFYPLARPLETTPVPGVTDTPLLITAEQSWAESDPQNQKLQFNEKSDRKGPLVLGVALERNLTNPETSSPSPSPQPIRNSRMVAIGNSEFATDGRFGQQLNGDVFLNSMSWLADKESKNLSIRPKELTSRRFDLSPEEYRFLGLIALAMMPLVGVITSIVLWLRRR